MRGERAAVCWSHCARYGKFPLEMPFLPSRQLSENANGNAISGCDGLLIFFFRRDANNCSRLNKESNMNACLPASPVFSLLDRLFAQAAATPIPEMTPDARAEVDQLMRSKNGYREFYGRARELWLPVSREAGLLLYMLARSSGARSIVEFGTSFGISTLFLAAALRENGGGRLIGTEFEPSKVTRARAHLAEAGLDDLVEIREGDALQTLATGLPESIDLVLLDGAKALYSDVLDLLVDRLRPGALIVADNADYCPEYLARVRARNSGFASIPFGSDVELTLRAG
jgi:predicted O-methyltransferase YrrM